MNNYKSIVFGLIALLGLVLCSCTTVPTTDNTRKAFLYAEVGQEQLDQAGRLDSSHGTSVTVGEVYQLRKGSEAEDGLPGDGSAPAMVGLASDLGFGFGTGCAHVGDVSLHTDRFALNMGLRYYFDTGVRWAQPYVGAGFAPQMLHASSNVGDNEDGFAFTGYGLVGVDCALGERWRLGIAYRKSIGAEFDLGDSNRLNFNDSVFGLSLGYSF